MKSKTLVIIPARGGSKGVKNKNLRLLNDKPLICYAVDCARESKLTDELVVSTDDDKIATILREYNCAVIKRPLNLAQDDTPMPPVLIHAIEQLSPNEYDIVILLQPTSPIRTGEDVDNVIRMMKNEPDLEAVISVVPMDDIHPARMYNLDEYNKMIPYTKSGETARRQDLPVVYYRNGCIYAIRRETLIREKSLIVSNKKAYIMPFDLMLNIDSERDMAMAESMMNYWKKSNLH